MHVTRPELDKAVALAREIRASGAAVTIVVYEHKRLGRGIELAALAEQLRADGIGLESLTGELQGSHDPSGVVFTVLAALRPPPAPPARPKEIITRLLHGECERCHTRTQVETHQVRKLADLAAQPGREQPAWAAQMAKMRRKTLIVCAPCHQAIHHGKPAANCT